MFTKKYVAAFLVGQMLLTGITASAETGVSVSGSATISPGVLVSPTDPTLQKSFVQFNNLTVQSVSSQTVPGEIIAMPEVIPMDVPVGMMSAGVSTSPASSAVPQNCYKYRSQNDSAGTPVACPMLAAVGGNNPQQFVYRIKVDSSTGLLLRDRSVAKLGDFSAGDQINVFGYYNTDGSLTAYLVRNLSKPVSREFMQLNNMTLVSVSGNTLALVQDRPSPCYRFESETSVKSTLYPCPMGVTDFSARAETKNVAAPTSLSAQWMMLRKYVVTVDANTVILDRNRTRLALSNLQVGDKLNIYGETSDNGQTLMADIIRDVSLPVSAQEYSGKVTAVNADGSFVIQTNTGRIVTVKNPVEVGMTVKIRGLLDEVQNIITQISQINLSR